MTYQHNPLIIIFLYLPDECGDNSCSCYCIPHRDADSIYSRMRIVTLEPSFHCSTSQPKREAFNWRSIPSMKSYTQIPKRIVRDILELLYCHRKAISGRKMLFNWRFWWLTLWLIISYALWNDEIKLCILSPCLMLYFKHFLYWLKDLEFPCNKLYSFSLNFLYLNIYIFVKGWCI